MFKSFPFYSQLDQMDCGPSCVRMIAKYYGKNYSLSELRRKSYLNRDGVSLLGISDSAESIGFKTIAVKIPFEKLAMEAPLPCIVHWNQNHFIVVHKITKSKVHVADPGVGLLVYTKAEFENGWLSNTGGLHKFGLALLLEPTPAFYKNSAELVDDGKKSLRYLFSYFKTYKRFIIQLLIGLLLGSLIQLIIPFLTQSIVDIGINTQNVSFIYIVLTGQLVLMLSRTSVEFIRRWILLHLSTRISISIISDFLIKLVQLPLSFFEQKIIGDLLRRIDDHSRVERFLSSSSLSILFSFFNLLIFGIVLAIYSVPIILVFLIGSSLYISYILIFMKKRERLDYKRFEHLAQNQSNLIQLVQGMQEIKLNNCEKQKRWEWERIQAKLFKVTIEGLRLQQYQEAGGTFINEFKNIIITVMSATAVINGSMTLGMMLAVQYIIGQLNVPILEFVNFIRDYQDAKISLERISEIHSHQNEDNGTTTNSINQHDVTESNDIVIRDLSFRYDGSSSSMILKNINLNIKAGKVTAIVGESGCGKTTLMKLLLKFYPLTGGEISVGGIGLERINSSVWRSGWGVVMQDGYIFSDTIERNIALKDEEIDYKKLSKAIKIANIKDFIESLPLGYNTKIGSDGLSISQGQKQRLLIARAVYKNPEYLFFDEATSSLDASNERIIMENLRDFYRNKTVVVIAHRLSTVRNADQIIVLRNGELLEIGNHIDLVKSNGFYFNLVKDQLELSN